MALPVATPSSVCLPGSILMFLSGASWSGARRWLSHLKANWWRSTAKRFAAVFSTRGIIRRLRIWSAHLWQRITRCWGSWRWTAKKMRLSRSQKLLELLDLTGATVTIDAMGCQTKIAGKIVENGGDYVLSVKDNQPALHQAIQRNMKDLLLEKFKGVRHGHVQTVDGDHGRIETRDVWVTDQLEWLGDENQRWPGLKSVAVVESKRELPIKGTSIEHRYYISSHGGVDAQAMATRIRRHWSVENNLHWVLDVSFDEDKARQRKGHSAQNFSRLRRIALNLLNREKTKKTRHQRQTTECSLGPRLFIKAADGMRMRLPCGVWLLCPLVFVPTLILVTLIGCDRSST